MMNIVKVSAMASVAQASWRETLVNLPSAVGTAVANSAERGVQGLHFMQNNYPKATAAVGLGKGATEANPVTQVVARAAAAGVDLSVDMCIKGAEVLDKMTGRKMSSGLKYLSLRAAMYTGWHFVYTSVLLLKKEQARKLLDHIVEALEKNVYHFDEHEDGSYADPEPISEEASENLLKFVNSARKFEIDYLDTTVVSTLNPCHVGRAFGQFEETLVALAAVVEKLLSAGVEKSGLMSQLEGVFKESFDTNMSEEEQAQMKELIEQLSSAQGEETEVGKHPAASVNTMLKELINDPETPAEVKELMQKPMADMEKMEQSEKATETAVAKYTKQACSEQDDCEITTQNIPREQMLQIETDLVSAAKIALPSEEEGQQMFDSAVTFSESFKEFNLHKQMDLGKEMTKIFSEIDLKGDENVEMAEQKIQELMATLGLDLDKL